MITLKVKNGYRADYGRRIARVDEDLMYSLGVLLPYMVDILAS
jgi:hypothetical protein